ncbi:hypothetical protein C5C74_09505 [Rathayibacter sp. AY1E8]|uniref:hypothetical protein n=1 Tax=unclassified Rathayibacter TaxID=2609250 RepID=UPI000CE8A91E|nr:MULTISPECIES: hypothetical protein [unclassified Rathayibacter]PPG17967.1 hypothetical protein C5C74_09505 [Rathayibacter sp. AY1E8]PPI01191.1 hypothetical protein C5C95_03380 [Rathayibacter sp. AY1B7]
MMDDDDERRANASCNDVADAPIDQGGSEDGQENVDQAAALELHAREYDAQADEGGTSEQTPDQLRVLADDARAQAQLYRDNPSAQTAADKAAASERAAAGGDLNQSIAAEVELGHLNQFGAEAEADRLAQFDDRYQRALDRGDVHEVIDVLLDEATRYEQEADAGGTATETPERLRALAAENRDEAAYFKNKPLPSQTARSADATPAGTEGWADALRSESEISYDSAGRRTATANEIKAHGIQQDLIDVKMRADIAQGRPANEAVAQAGRVQVPNTNLRRSVGLSQERGEQAR